MVNEARASKTHTFCGYADEHLDCSLNEILNALNEKLEREKKFSFFTDKKIKYTPPGWIKKISATPIYVINEVSD